MNIKILIIMLIGFIILISCSNENTTEPTTLIADAGLNLEVEPGETVTLDGSKSQGPNGFTYLWTYSGDVPENEINFQNINSAKPTFVPPYNGVYEFTLKISSGGDSDEDQTTVVCNGAVKLGGTLTEDLELSNLRGDSDLPDYIITNELTVENGIKLSIIENNVKIKFEAGAGLRVQSGGILTNVNPNDIYGFDVEFYGEDGWKGILVKDGKINLNNAIIKSGGSENYFGYEESAALIFEGRSTNIIDFSENRFINSPSYDILVLDKPSGNGRLKNNHLSARIPIKSPITFMEYWHSGEPFIFPEDFDYVHLIPGGADKKDVISSNFVFHENGKYYIDGDFWAGNSLNFQLNFTLYIKENCGIYVAGGNFLTTYNLLETTENIIEGLNNATWRGIAVANNNSFEIHYTTIRNAGYGIIKMGQFEAEAQAAIYTGAPSNGNRVGYIEHSSIINSGGYGYYNSYDGRSLISINHSSFINTANAAIRTSVASVDGTLPLTQSNVFDLGDNIPAYLVVGKGSAGSTWANPGERSYYLIDADVVIDKNFSFAPGTILKFKKGRYLASINPNAILFMESYQQSPIILEGELSESGSWGGLYLASDFRIINAVIRDGGEFILPGATEKTNIVSAIPSGITGAQLYMAYSEVTNSAGYGIVIEARTKDIEYEKSEWENIFMDNATGNILRK